jgi:hypothetical protein
VASREFDEDCRLDRSLCIVALGAAPIIAVADTNSYYRVLAPKDDGKERVALKAGPGMINLLRRSLHYQPGSDAAALSR